FQTTDPKFEPIAAHFRALEGEAATYQTTWQGRTFQAPVEPPRGAEGAISGVLGIAVDVTEHRETEAELRRSIALLSATIDATADAILVVDAAGKMVNFNRRFVELWGIPEPVAESRDESKALA